MSTHTTKKTSGKAVTSLILGLISLLCLPCCILSLPAIILGFMGMGDAAKGQGGKGMAITGVITGVLSLFCAAGAGVGGAFFGYPMVQQRAARMQSQNYMKQMALAFHSHNDAYKKMPNHAIYTGNLMPSPNAKPLLSWRVAILPYIEQINLYRRFRLDEPWDSPHNKSLLKEMPKIYAHPWETEAAKKGLTYYQVFVGDAQESPSPPFMRKAQFFPSLSRITGQDGSSNTILLVEAATPVPWTKPADIPYSRNRPLPKLGVFSGGFNAAICDGSVVFIPHGRVSDRTLRNAITANDNMPLGSDWPR